jgi:hypothetical protein
MLTISLDNRSAFQRLLQQKNNKLLSILAAGNTSFVDRKSLYTEIISICKAITAGRKSKAD